jgi:hypothetical protein
MGENWQDWKNDALQQPTKHHKLLLICTFCKIFLTYKEHGILQELDTKNKIYYW